MQVVFTGDEQAAMPLFCGGTDHIQSFLRLSGRTDNVTAFFYNAALFARDLRQRIAENFSMIIGNMREHGAQRRVDDIRGIEAATQANLQDHHVAFLLRKPIKPNRSHRLKFRKLLPRLFHLLDQRQDILGRLGKRPMADGPVI